MTEGILSISGYSEPQGGLAPEVSVGLSEAFLRRVDQLHRAFAPLLRHSRRLGHFEDQAHLAKCLRSQLLLACERLYNGRFQVEGLDFRSLCQSPGAVLRDSTQISPTT